MTVILTRSSTDADQPARRF